jgi:hypothetical protein
LRMMNKPTTNHHHAASHEPELPHAH